jgi:hypothetical protein
MTRLVLVGSCALAVLALPSAARATTITFTDMAPFTEYAQVFHFDFSGAPPSEGEGTLRIDAQGDFTLGFGDPSDPFNEFLTWDIDGVTSGVAAPDFGTPGPSLCGPGEAPIMCLNKVIFHQYITISALDMAAITADGQIHMTLMASLGINRFYDDEFEFVGVTLEYTEAVPEIPEPSTMLLLASGLGLAGWRSRKGRGASS